MVHLTQCFNGSGKKGKQTHGLSVCFSPPPDPCQQCNKNLAPLSTNLASHSILKINDLEETVKITCNKFAKDMQTAGVVKNEDRSLTQSSLDHFMSGILMLVKYSVYCWEKIR